MFCSQCGASNGADARFCSSCGIVLSKPSRPHNTLNDGSNAAVLAKRVQNRQLFLGLTSLIFLVVVISAFYSVVSGKFISSFADGNIMDNKASSVNVIGYAWGWKDASGVIVRGTIDNETAADVPCVGSLFTLVGVGNTYTPDMTDATYCSSSTYAPKTRGLIFLHFNESVQRGHYSLRFQHLSGSDIGAFETVPVDIGDK